MPKINSIGNKSGELTIDPGASGDSFVQFDINGTGEFRIGVDDTDDSFRISQGSALGTNDTFIMTAAGERTMPLNPCFLAYAALQSNSTGDGTLYTITFTGGEYFDQNDDFDGTSTFTASVTGKFNLFAQVYLGGISAVNTSTQFRCVTSNRTYIYTFYDPGTIRNSSDQISLTFSMIVDMDASDTATTSILVSGGTKIVDILATETIFGGCLVT